MFCILNYTYPINYTYLINNGYSQIKKNEKEIKKPKRQGAGSAAERTPKKTGKE